MKLEQQRARTSPWKGLLVGASGAAVVNLAHEVVRQLVPGAPRIDRLGMVALARGLKRLGVAPPRGERLRGYTLLGDLVANSMYYAPVASGRRPWLRGVALGAIAGVLAVALPARLGLPRRHRGLRPRTQAMTVALYTAGGLVAGAVASYLDRGNPAPREREQAREPAGAGATPTPGLTPAGDIDVLVFAM